MNIIKIEPCAVNAGTGCRVVLWLAGCPHHCKGCHNPETWNINQGHKVEVEPKDWKKDPLLKQFYELLQKPNIQGLSITGGEPLIKDNLKILLNMCIDLKQDPKTKAKDIWLWTGYKYEDIIDYHILRYIDVLVDGEFEIDKRDITLPFRGSRNQRVIKLNTYFTPLVLIDSLTKDQGRPIWQPMVINKSEHDIDKLVAAFFL